MDKKQRRLLIFFGLVAAVVWAQALSPSSRVRRASAKLISRSGAVSAPAAPAREGGIRSQYAEWGGNPFLMEREGTVSEAKPEDGGPVLSGILWDPKRPVAVINGSVVGIGDSVDHWQVTGINPNDVTLSDGLTSKTIQVE